MFFGSTIVRPRGLPSLARLFTSDATKIVSMQPIACRPHPYFILKQLRNAEEYIENPIGKPKNFAKEQQQKTPLPFKKQPSQQRLELHNINSQQTYINPRKEQKRPRPKKSPLPPSPPIDATSRWIEIHQIPPMANLIDIVTSVDKVMENEQELGILDLDRDLLPDGTLPILPHHHGSWVKSARFVLSAHGRPTSWRIEFESRSVTHAFLERAKAVPFVLVWKPVPVSEWCQGSSTPEPAPLIEVDETMIRVENFDNDITLDSMRHLFRRYDLAPTGPTILPWVCKPTGFKLFVVRFRDASWARAAVRELQGVEVNGRQLRLAQYPKQIIRENETVDEEMHTG